jgi:O-antigen ligase
MKRFFINVKEKNKAINLIIFLLLLTTVIFFTIKSFSSNRLIEPRLIYFYVTLKTIINQPMGIGFYNFGDVSLKYPRIGFFTSEIHNIFLEILIGGGVVAFVFLVFFSF